MNQENDTEFWKRQYEVIRKEREDSFAMLSKTVGKIGCTPSQPEVDLEIDARIRQIIRERDYWTDPEPITESWLKSVGLEQKESPRGPGYSPHFHRDVLKLWEFNGTGEWLWAAGDTLGVTDRGELRMLARLLRVTLDEPSP